MNILEIAYNVFYSSNISRIASIITAGRKDDLRARFLPKFIDQYGSEEDAIEVFETLVAKDPSRTGSSPHKYLQWLCDQTTEFPDSVDEIIEAANLFDQNRHKLKKKDLFAYKEHSEITDELEKQEVYDQASVDLLPNAKILYPPESENSRFLVVPVNSADEMKHYGRGTRWCVAQRPGFYDRYTRNGEKFFILFDLKENTKYAYYFLTDQRPQLWEPSDIEKGTFFLRDLVGSEYQPIHQAILSHEGTPSTPYTKQEEQVESAKTLSVDDVYDLIAQNNQSSLDILPAVNPAILTKAHKRFMDDSEHSEGRYGSRLVFYELFKYLPSKYLNEILDKIPSSVAHGLVNKFTTRSLMRLHERQDRRLNDAVIARLPKEKRAEYAAYALNDGMLRNIPIEIFREIDTFLGRLNNVAKTTLLNHKVRTPKSHSKIVEDSKTKIDPSGSLDPVKGLTSTKFRVDQISPELESTLSRYTLKELTSILRTLKSSKAIEFVLTVIQDTYRPFQYYDYVEDFKVERYFVRLMPDSMLKDAAEHIDTYSRESKTSLAYDVARFMDPEKLFRFIINSGLHTYIDAKAYDSLSIAQLEALVSKYSSGSRSNSAVNSAIALGKKVSWNDIPRIMKVIPPVFLPRFFVTCFKRKSILSNNPEQIYDLYKSFVDICNANGIDLEDYEGKQLLPMFDRIAEIPNIENLVDKDEPKLSLILTSTLTPKEIVEAISTDPDSARDYFNYVMHSFRSVDDILMFIKWFRDTDDRTISVLARQLAVRLPLAELFKLYRSQNKHVNFYHLILKAKPEDVESLLNEASDSDQVASLMKKAPEEILIVKRNDPSAKVRSEIARRIPLKDGLLYLTDPDIGVRRVFQNRVRKLSPTERASLGLKG